MTQIAMLLLIRMVVLYDRVLKAPVEARGQLHKQLSGLFELLPAALRGLAQHTPLRRR